MEEQGFYNIDSDGIMHHAPNFVYAPDFTLLIDDKDTYTYPINGWYWCNTLVEAQVVFNTTQRPNSWPPTEAETLKIQLELQLQEQLKALQGA